MRIDDGNKLAPTLPTDRSQKTDTHRVQDETPHSTPDVSAISDIAAQASSLGGTNEQRLEALRVAVESGTYHVSSSALAKSIIDSHLTP